MGIKIGNWRIGNNDNAIAFLVICSLAYYPITYTVNQIVNRYIQSGAWWDSAICSGIYAIAVLLSVGLIVKRQTMFTLGLLFVSVLIFIVTIGLNMDGATYASSNLVKFVTSYYPFIFLGVSIREFDELDHPVDIITRVITVSALIWIAIVVFGFNRGIRVAYMSVSYYVLPSTLLRIYYFFRDRKIINLFWMVAAIICHIIWGTRGPILFCLVFLSLCLIWNKRTKTGAIAALGLALIGVLLYVNFFTILQWLNGLFLSHGIQNGGIIKLLAQDDLFDGRGDLFGQLIPYINDHWLIGGGIYSDRKFLGTYAHLLPFELVCDFGVPIGIMLFIILIIAIIKKLGMHKDYYDIRWAILWVTMIVGFAKLFISGSYLEDPYFYFFLGLLSNSNMKIKNTTEAASA